jgi:hypothetical protein
MFEYLTYRRTGDVMPQWWREWGDDKAFSTISVVQYILCLPSRWDELKCLICLEQR